MSVVCLTVCGIGQCALDFREKGNVVLLLNSEKFLRRGASCPDTAIPN